MKLRVVRVRAFGPSVSAEDLQLAVNTWLSSQDPNDAVTEEELVDIQFQVVSGDLSESVLEDVRFWAFVTYVDA